jgi:hypothetical protein
MAFWDRSKQRVCLTRPWANWACVTTRSCVQQTTWAKNKRLSFHRSYYMGRISLGAEGRSFWKRPDPSSRILEAGHDRPPTGRSRFPGPTRRAGWACLTCEGTAGTVINSPTRFAVPPDPPSPQVLAQSSCRLPYPCLGFPRCASSRSAAISNSQGIDSAPCSDPAMTIAAPIRFDCRFESI